MSIQLTAYAPVPSLLTSLANAGWGELAGHSWKGARSILDALARSLPYKTASGYATAYQIAQRAGGMSERWTRRCLEFLEEIGLIQWNRGGIVDGKPAPSYFRIVKSKIIELIALAYPSKSKRDQQHRRATLQRISLIKARYIKTKKAISPSSSHAELSSSPSPHYMRESPAPRGTTPHRKKKYPPASKKKGSIMSENLCSHHRIISECGICQSHVVACAHSSDVRLCHRCVSLDNPPTGYRFDHRYCVKCCHLAKAHELFMRTDDEPHRLAPLLVKC